VLRLPELKGDLEIAFDKEDARMKTGRAIKEFPWLVESLLWGGVVEVGVLKIDELGRILS
jgi:hypothetical protein